MLIDPLSELPITQDDQAGIEEANLYLNHFLSFLRTYRDYLDILKLTRIQQLRLNVILKASDCSNLELSKTVKYDSKKDVVRMDVAVEKLPESAESFTLFFEKLSKGISLQIRWDDIKVVFPISTL